MPRMSAKYREDCGFQQIFVRGFIRVTILVQLVLDLDFVQQKLNKDSFGCELAKELSE